MLRSPWGHRGCEGMRALRDRRGSPDLPRSPSIRRAPCAGSTGEGGTERCPPPVGTRRGGGTAGRRAPGVQHSPPYTLHTPPSHPSAQHAALHARNPPRRDPLMADITVSTGGGALPISRPPQSPNPRLPGQCWGGGGLSTPLPTSAQRDAGPDCCVPHPSLQPPPHKYLQAAGCDAPSIWHSPPWHGQRARSAGRPGTVSLADWCHLPHAGLGMGDKGLPGPGGGARRCAKGSTVPPQGSLPSPPPPLHTPRTHLFAPLGSAKGHCWGKIAAGQRWGRGCGVPPQSPPEAEGGGTALTLCTPSGQGVWIGGVGVGVWGGGHWNVSMGV